MDKHSGKRGATGSMAPGKRYNVGFKDANTSKDQNAQFCNRIGCRGRLKYSNHDTKIGSSGKGKCSKPAFCSSNGNEMIGNSSRSGSVMTRAKRSHLDSKRKLSSQSVFDPSESSQSGDSGASQLSSLPDRNPEDISSSSMTSNIRPRKLFHPESGLYNNNNQTASSVPSVSRSSGLGAVNGSRKSRCLKNLKCNSISDVVPSNSSSSGSKSSRTNVMKNRSPEGEGKLSIRGPSTSGASIYGSRRCSFASREDSSSASSVRTGRSSYINQNKMRFSYQQNVRNSSRGREPAVRIPRFPSSALPVNVGRPSFSQKFSANGSSSGSSSYSISSSHDDNQSTMMPSSSAELGFSHLFHRDALQRYNMDGIDEVLLALERIEQDHEMTHEQILALETSLFMSGINLYDQHQDMRLDIDDMSYEELLALGERMGTVSTALSEEALLKCVKRSIYQVNPSEERSSGSDEDGDDVKCSICQEEYEMGDEVGKLVECQHTYHVACINQWLRQKNWCPICKTAAAPPNSSSSY